MPLPPLEPRGRQFLPAQLLVAVCVTGAVAAAIAGGLIAANSSCLAPGRERPAMVAAAVLVALPATVAPWRAFLRAILGAAMGATAYGLLTLVAHVLYAHCIR